MTEDVPEATDIYAAAVEHVLVAMGHDPAADVFLVPRAGARAAELAVLTERLGAGWRVRVVAEERDVLGPDHEGSPVRDGGALVAVGPVGGHSDGSAQVRLSAYKSMHRAEGGDYHLHREADGWRVTGAANTFSLG